MQQKPLKVIAGTPDRPVKIGDIEIPCYVLEDETRVFSKRGMYNAFGVVWSGNLPKEAGTEIEGQNLEIPENGGESVSVVTGLPGFLGRNWIRPHLTDELVMGLKSPILMEVPPGVEGYGYPATILVDICDAILTAHLENSTTQRQKNLVSRARVLTNGFATIGIIGLIDEATGYQRLREERALAKILERYIAKKLQPWAKTFPYEFYAQIFRLKEWDAPDGVKRPSVIGHYTNDLVYKRLAPGILEELKEKNPVLPSGNRGARHHQWFTPDYGHPQLREHMAGVIALMKVSRTWNIFMGHMDRIFPKHGTTIPFEFLTDDDQE